MGDHLTPVILWLWPGLHLSPLVSSSWGLLVATQKIIWSWGVWVSVIVHDWVSERERERDVEQKRTISKTASDTSLSFIHQSVWPRGLMLLLELHNEIATHRRVPRGRQKWTTVNEGKDRERERDRENRHWTRWSWILSQKVRNEQIVKTEESNRMNKSLFLFSCDQWPMLWSPYDRNLCL